MGVELFKCWDFLLSSTPSKLNSERIKSHCSSWNRTKVSFVCLLLVWCSIKTKRKFIFLVARPSAVTWQSRQGIPDWITLSKWIVIQTANPQTLLTGDQIARNKTRWTKSEWDQTERIHINNTVHTYLNTRIVQQLNDLKSAYLCACVWKIWMKWADQQRAEAKF